MKVKQRGNTNNYRKYDNNNRNKAGKYDVKKYKENNTEEEVREAHNETEGNYINQEQTEELRQSYQTQGYYRGEYNYNRGYNNYNQGGDYDYNNNSRYNNYTNYRCGRGKGYYSNRGSRGRGRSQRGGYYNNNNNFYNNEGFIEREVDLSELDNTNNTTLILIN